MSQLRDIVEAFAMLCMLAIVFAATAPCTEAGYTEDATQRAYKPPSKFLHTAARPSYQSYIAPKTPFVAPKTSLLKPDQRFDYDDFAPTDWRASGPAHHHEEYISDHGPTQTRYEVIYEDKHSAPDRGAGGIHEKLKLGLLLVGAKLLLGKLAVGKLLVLLALKLAAFKFKLLAGKFLLKLAIVGKLFKLATIPLLLVPLLLLALLPLAPLLLLPLLLAPVLLPLLLPLLLLLPVPVLAPPGGRSISVAALTQRVMATPGCMQRLACEMGENHVPPAHLHTVLSFLEDVGSWLPPGQSTLKLAEYTRALEDGARGGCRHQCPRSNATLQLHL